MAGDHEQIGPVIVNVRELGPGWAAVVPGDPPPEPYRVSGLLHKTLVSWLQEHPQYQVRATLGIVEGGETVAIHVWYEVTS